MRRISPSASRAVDSTASRCRSTSEAGAPSGGPPSARAARAATVCREIIAQKYDYAILLDMNGVGINIAANRYPQIRASLVDDEESARVSRQQSNSKVGCVA